MPFNWIVPWLFNLFLTFSGSNWGLPRVPRYLSYGIQAFFNQSYFTSYFMPQRHPSLSLIRSLSYKPYSSYPASQAFIFPNPAGGWYDVLFFRPPQKFIGSLRSSLPFGPLTTPKAASDLLQMQNMWIVWVHSRDWTKFSFIPSILRIQFRSSRFQMSIVPPSVNVDILGFLPPLKILSTGFS